MNLYSEFTKYCRFWFKIFQNVMWKNSIFLTSEARLSPNLQNWTKLLRFYNSGLSGQLSFEWPDWKSLGLNYSSVDIVHTCQCKSFHNSVFNSHGRNAMNCSYNSRNPMNPHSEPSIDMKILIFMAYKEKGLCKICSSVSKSHNQVNEKNFQSNKLKDKIS